MNKFQLITLRFIKKQMDKRAAKPHRKPNQCNDCGTIAVPLYQINVLNIVFYFIVGAIIMFTWNIFLGIGVAIGCLVLNVILAKPECPQCNGRNIEVYQTPMPNAMQTQIKEIDQTFEKAEMLEENTEEKELEKEMEQIEKEVDAILNNNKVEQGLN